MNHPPSNYTLGALTAETDRKLRQTIPRYRVQAGEYQFRGLNGAWYPVGSDDLADRARGYLDTYHGESLYV